LAACEPAPIVSITTTFRPISVDVRNTLFNPADANNPATQGLGVTSLSLAVETDPAPPGGAWTASLVADSRDLTAAANGYTRVSIPLDGKLLSVTATAQTASGTFTQALTAYPGSTVYQGWTDFANVVKFRLAYSVGSPVSESYLSLSVAPKGGSAATVRADSGASATSNPENKGLTDRSATLVSRMAAVQIRLDENPAGITYNVYTAVIDKDIDTLYNPDVNFAGTYVTDPWTPAWTYAEIAGTGRSVGGTVYTLSKYRPTAYNAVDPQGDGMLAIEIDLRTSTDPKLTDKFLLVGVTVTSGDLSVPVDVLCLDIQ
jgi:hypothetical protein